MSGYVATATRSASATSAASPIHVDLSRAGPASLREAILRRLAASGRRPRPFDRFWRCLAAGKLEAIPRGLLVFGDLSGIGRAFTETARDAWSECFRRRHPLLAGLVRRRADERQAALVDDVLRASGSRLWVYTVGEARERDLERCVTEMVARLDPDVVIDVRYADAERNIWIEFADGLRRTLSWSALALDEVNPPLRPETVRLGRDDPESVEFLDTRGAVFDIDAASLRAMVDPEAARRQFAVVEAAALTLGERLRARRQALGVTQVQLASRAGLTQEMISNLERGRHQPRFTTLEKYARGLGVPVGKLLGS